MRQQLSDAIEDYMSFRGSMGLAKRSLKNERAVLLAFLNVNGNLYVDNLAERHVTRHFGEVGRTRSPHSLKLDYTYLNQFFAWCRKTRRMGPDNDPMYGRRKPKSIERERERLHVSKFGALLDVCDETDPMVRAMGAIFLYTLLRDQEALTLRIRHLDLDAGWLRATIYKTGVEDRVPICSELDTEMRRWLTHYTKVAGPLDRDWYLLPRRRIEGTMRREDGRIVGHEMVYAPTEKVFRASPYIRPALDKMGISARRGDGEAAYEGAHTLRRSGARALFDSLSANGYDHSLRVVQSMLHHKSVTQTERYIGLEADRRTRDEIIRGKPMYGMPEVATLRVAH